MRPLLKYIMYALICTIIIYASVEGFSHCNSRTWGVCTSSTPELGEKCSKSCYTGTCQKGICSGSTVVGGKCAQTYDCAATGPNGRDTYCNSKICSEVPKMSFN